MTQTGAALQHLARPLRGLRRAAWAATALGLVALLLGGAAWLARLGALVTPLWVLGAWGAALLAVGVFIWRARRRDGDLATGGVARHLEASGAWRRGALTALLDAPAPGTSDQLLAAADRTQADDVRRRGREALAPVAGAVRRQSLIGALCLVAGLGVLGAAGPRHGTAAALWRPARAWRAVAAPVSLRASAGDVDRGAQVTLVAEALGRREATLWTRAPGESWRAQSLELDSLGRSAITVGPLTSDLYARVTSGSRSSDTLVVRVRIAAFLGALAVTAHYPAYLGLDAEPVPTTGDTLLLPVGTRLETVGEATTPLRAARWSGPGATSELRVEGRGFRGNFVPAASGDYRLAVTTAVGAPLAGDAVRLPVRLVPDSAPRIDVPVPGADTAAPAGLQLPLVLDVRDDHGLTEVVLETRRVSRAGVQDPVRRERVTLPAARTDRAILGVTLDLAGRGLEPGDTLRYVAVAVDNAPRAHVGRSREYAVRLATASELRAVTHAAGGAVQRQLDSLAAESRRMERQTEDLAREQRAAQPRTGSDPRSQAIAPNGGAQDRQALSYEQSKRAEAAARDQQQLMQKAEATQKALEELRRSAQAAGLNDSSFLRQLAEVRSQLEHALSPELREKLARLQSSLKSLDAEQTKDALKDLADAQRELREALERSRELFRRAALEGDLTNLKQEARDLAQEQQRWTDQVPATDSARAAAQERRLAQRTDSLGKALQQLAAESAKEGQSPKLQQGAQQAQQAASRMQQASKAAQAGQRQQAQSLGREAAQQLQPVGDEVQQAQQQLAQQWRDEVMQALESASAEASRLGERQLQIQEQLRRGAPPQSMRGDQAAVAEGVQKLAEKMRGAAGKNALVPPQIGKSLASAQEEMARTMESMSSAGGSPREAAERAGEALDAMNGAAYQMMQARGDVAGSSSGSGMAEAMEKMTQLAQQQGAIGRQAGGLLPGMGTGQGGQQVQQLGGRQRALAAELERMRGQGQISGAGEMAQEARDLARQLEAGRLDRATVERQERLFRRMLDAGRTLQGQEEDKQERKSTTATGDSVHLPPALRDKLLGDEKRPRVPSWEELQRLSPEERRLVVDYFRRLAEQRETAP